jgi:hypothetical protein
MCARSARARCSCFGARLLQYGDDRREGQNDKGNAGNHQGHRGLIETRVSLDLMKRALSGKNGPRHRRIVQTGNGQAHNDGGNELLPEIRGSKCQPQSRRRGADRYEEGERNVETIVAMLGLSRHGSHAGVMHGGNAKSHEETAENEARQRCALAADDVKADAGDEDRDDERKGRQSDVVGHRHRHSEGEHGDEVH